MSALGVAPRRMAVPRIESQTAGVRNCHAAWSDRKYGINNHFKSTLSISGTPAWRFSDAQMVASRPSIEARAPSRPAGRPLVQR